MYPADELLGILNRVPQPDTALALDKLQEVTTDSDFVVIPPPGRVTATLAARAARLVRTAGMSRRRDALIRRLDPRAGPVEVPSRTSGLTLVRTT
jgi:hypothetical protein